jgi:hypothetical protein
MAKFKLAKAKGKTTSKQSARGAVPCIIFVIGIMAFLMLLFFYALKG